MTTSPSVLLVDDEPIIVKSMKRYLELQGYLLVTCENGAEALALAWSRHFDIVIADLDLPALNGLELLRRIRPVHPTALLIITSGTTPLDQRWPPLPDEGIVALPKPFDLDELLEIMRRAAVRQDLSGMAPILLSESRLMVCRGRLVWPTKRPITVKNR